MDLRNYEITIRELKGNPMARELLDTHLPGLLDMQIALMYPSMTLDALLRFSHVPQSKRDFVIQELINI